MSLAEALADMLDAKRAQGRSSSTINNYEKTIRVYRRWLDRERIEPTIDALDVRLARRFLSWLRDVYTVVNPSTGTEKRVGSATIRQYAIDLKSIAKWLAAEGYFEANPLERLALPAREHPVIVPFTADQYAALLTQAASGSEARWLRARNMAILLFCYDTAARVSEVTNLAMADLQLSYTPDLGRVVLRSTKAKRDRFEYFSTRTADALRTYLGLAASNRHTDRVFIAGPSTHGTAGGPMSRRAIAALLHRLAHRAGIDGGLVRCSPHDLRHSSATEFARRAPAPAALMSLLGHTTMAMSLRYIHLASSDVEALARSSSPVDGLGALVDAIAKRIEPRGRWDSSGAHRLSLAR